MQKAELAFVIALLVIPPIVSGAGRADGSAGTLPAPAFSARLVALTTAAALLYARHRNVHLIRFQSRWTAMRIAVMSGVSLAAFGALCVSSALAALAGHLSGAGSASLSAPCGIAGWLGAAGAVICAAFYEEVLYRMYLPEELKSLLSSGGKIPAMVPECAGVLLFAAAHSYQGALGVANALVCGAALRRTIAATRSIWFALVPHAAYNMMALAAAAALEG